MSKQVEQSEAFVDRFYEMNPESEDLLAGDELENGLVVLMEDSMVREDASRAEFDPYAMKRLRENNGAESHPSGGMVTSFHSSASTRMASSVREPSTSPITGS